MSEEVKIYKIIGYMLISHNRFPMWQKFVQEVRALSEKDALEKVYSLLGSRHKLKRHHIKIVEIKTIEPGEATKPYIAQLLKLERVVKR